MAQVSQNIYLTAAKRTPIGKFGGGLSRMTAVDLGVHAAGETMRQAGLVPEMIDEVIIGCARQAGVGPNPARQIAFKSGMPASVPGYTINQACASGLKAIIGAVQSVCSGDARIVLAGGTESLSNVPYLLMKGRWGYRMGHERVLDAMYQDGYLCHLCDQIMGETADALGVRYGISREASDELAMLSQQRHQRARSSGRFSAELFALEVPGRKGTAVIDADEHPRPETTMAGLGKLKPVFAEDGIVTPGNASGITDGAATVLVYASDRQDEIDAEPMARVLDYQVAGVDPALMGIGPVPAVKELLRRNKLKLSDIDLVELNEAFAVQVLACDRELNFDFERLNVNGGAIAMGHPTGCTGARITVTLLHEMQKRQVTLGLATLCVSGGLGVAMLLENV